LVSSKTVRIRIYKPNRCYLEFSIVSDDYYCPASDSTGVRFILHTPLEMPHVVEFASVADLEKEILIKVHPDITNADDNIQDIKSVDAT